MRSGVVTMGRMMPYTIGDLEACWTGLKVRNLTVLSVFRTENMNGDHDVMATVEYQSNGKTCRRIVFAEEVLEAAEQHASMLPRVSDYQDGVLGRSGLRCNRSGLRCNVIVVDGFVSINLPYDPNEWPALARALRLQPRLPSGHEKLDATAQWSDRPPSREGVISDLEPEGQA